MPKPHELLHASAVWGSSPLGWLLLNVAYYFIRELTGSLEMTLAFACSDCLIGGGRAFMAFPPDFLVAFKQDG